MHIVDRWTCTNCGSDGTADREFGVVDHAWCEDCGHAVHSYYPSGYELELVLNAWPDGWTCDICGDEYDGKMPFSPQPEECGTVCDACGSNGLVAPF